MDPVRGLQRWPVKNIDIVMTSPDLRRVAYIEGGRFTGTISVRDVVTGKVITSGVIDEPMTIEWLGPTTLMYANSTMHDPSIYRVEVGEGFGTPELIHTRPTGWFSDLAYGGGKIFLVSMEPLPRGVALDRRNPTMGRKELDSVSLGIGWDAADRMVTWNKANKQLSSHAGKLDGEPANTTRSGDTLIAAVRALGGRRAIAVSLSTGRELWRHEDKRTIAVRCAADREPPCFAVRYIDEDHDEVFTLDPETGKLGAKSIYQQRKIEDIAVRADGKQLLVTQGAAVLEISSDGASVTKRDLLDVDGKVRLNLIRSVAYTKDGLLVSGTIGRNAYEVAHWSEGKYVPLDYASDKILMLVRASSDATQIVYLGRGYDPKLFRMHLP